MSLCMQEETFHHCCQHLLQLSQQLRDGWSWESAQVGLGNLCSLMLQKKKFLKCLYSFYNVSVRNNFSYFDGL